MRQNAMRICMIFLGFLSISLIRLATASDWPDGAEASIQEGCFNNILGGATNSATAEQIKAVNVACTCYAKQMSDSISWKEIEALRKKGATAGEEMDLSPAGQRLRLKLDMKCGSLFEAAKQ